MSSTNQIENLAKSHIETELNEIPNIETAFSAKDKFVSFDGNIIIYKYNKSSTTKKENILGMLPSQIKGRTFDKLPKPGSHAFSVDKEDMKVYYRESGVIYFIVTFLKNDNSKYRIYYNYLAPANIKDKYKNCGKSARFTFFEFTADAKTKFYSYCKNLLKVRRQQGILSQRPIEDQTICEDEKQETYDTYCFNGSTDDAIFFDITFHKESEKNGKMTIITNSRDWRSLTKVTDWIPSVILKNGLTIPIEHSINGTFSIHEIGSTSLKFTNTSGKFFYTQQTFVKIDNYLKVTLSECLELLIYEKKVTANLNKLGTLSERITAIFFLKSLASNELLINDKPFKLKDIPKKGLIRDLPEIYKSVTRIDLFVNEIPVLSSLREKRLSDDIKNYIERLSEEYYSISESTDDIGYEFCQKKIDTISIVLLKHTYLENGKKVQRFYDPFDGEIDNRIKIWLINSKDEIIAEKVSFFCTVSIEFWELAMNLNIDIVFNSISSLDFENKAIRDKINFLVLNLLTAYDNVNRENILSLAWKIIEKLDSYKDIDEDCFHINLLQTKKRIIGELDSNDITWLISHIQDQYKNTPIECAALILLGHKQAAKEKLAILPIPEREQILDYPIVHFL